MLPNHYGKFYQKPGNSSNQQAIFKQRIYKRLNPVTFNSPSGITYIGLSIGGKVFKSCVCRHLWVKPSQGGESITIWHCGRCGIPRLARRKKSDEELISELLKHPELKGWERFFTREMQRKKLGTRQREKLQGIAQRLGIRLEENCSLSDVEEVEA